MPMYKKFKKAKESPDKKLWPLFSIYIRLRDSNENGYSQCFTCKTFRYWRDGDCGHGIGRQHMACKYDEKNNHFQCKLCNGPGEGRKDRYKEEMNKRYGTGTWEMFDILKNKPCKMGRFEFEMLAIHYSQEIKKLLQTKNLKEGDAEKVNKVLVM